MRKQRQHNEARLYSFKRVLSRYHGLVPQRVAAAFGAADQGSATLDACDAAAAAPGRLRGLSRAGSQIAGLMQLLSAESSPWISRLLGVILATLLSSVTPLVTILPSALHACGGTTDPGGFVALCPATDAPGGEIACVASLAMSLAATIWFFYYVFAEFVTGIVRCACVLVW